MIVLCVNFGIIISVRVLFKILKYYNYHHYYYNICSRIMQDLIVFMNLGFQGVVSVIHNIENNKI